jgi:hypothetical protein
MEDAVIRSKHGTTGGMEKMGMHDRSEDGRSARDV